MITPASLGVLKRLCVLAAFLIAVRMLHAGTLYVDQASGNDGNRGSHQEPLESIARALSVMVPGDTCVVGGGIYREALVLPSGVTILALPGTLPVVTGTANLEVVWSVFRGHVYATDVSSLPGSIDRVNCQVFVDGEAMLEEKDAVIESTGGYFFDPSAKRLYVYMPEGDSPQNHRIDLRSRSIIISARNASGITLKGIAIYGSGVSFTNDSHLRIEDCSIRFPGYSARGLGSSARPSAFSSVTITGNDLIVRRCEFGNAPGGMSIGGKGISFTNNIVHDFGSGRDAAIQVASGTEQALLTFNTFIACGDSPIAAASGATLARCTLEHNEIEGRSQGEGTPTGTAHLPPLSADGADWSLTLRAGTMKQEIPGVVLVNDRMRVRVVDNAVRINAVDYSLLPGYNGLASLVYTGQERNIFAPAGLDYESCSTVPRMGKRASVWNAPRMAPLRITQVDARTARLSQRGSDAAGLNVEVTFHLGDSCIDQSITTWPDSDIQSSSTFWASYLLFVQNTSLYLRGRLHHDGETRWLEMTSAGHSGSGSGTYFRPCSPAGKAWYEFLTDNPVTRQAVFETPESRSATELAGFEPGTLESFDNFFFGFVDNYVALWIFRQPPNGRFTPWVSASGAQALRRPAADFTIESGPQRAGERRRFYVRFVYRPYEGLDDVLREVAQFQSSPAE